MCRPTARIGWGCGWEGWLTADRQPASGRACGGWWLLDNWSPCRQINSGWQVLQPSGIIIIMKVSSYDNVKLSKTGVTAINNITQAVALWGVYSLIHYFFLSLTGCGHPFTDCSFVHRLRSSVHTSVPVHTCSPIHKLSLEYVHPDSSCLLFPPGYL